VPSTCQQNAGLESLDSVLESTMKNNITAWK